MRKKRREGEDNTGESREMHQTTRRRTKPPHAGPHSRHSEKEREREMESSCRASHYLRFHDPRIYSRFQVSRCRRIFPKPLSTTRQKKKKLLLHNTITSRGIPLQDSVSCRSFQVGYYFASSGKPYPDNWIITDVIYEIEGALYSRSGSSVSGNPGVASGDETVPYHSLSWCKTWLGTKVNITRAPQPEHDGSDVQLDLNVEHHHGAYLVPNMTRVSGNRYKTYYEDSESIPGKRTAVWELHKGLGDSNGAHADHERECE